MKQIGKGAFTTAYLDTDGKVLLKSVDRVKEAMACGFFPDHRLFPKIEQVDQGEHYDYYKMKFYKKFKSLKNNLTPRQWRLYKILRGLYIPCNFNPHTMYNILCDVFETQIPNEFKAEREALLEALHGLCNYGTDMMFEISPRNVAIEGKKLILLDCFFFKTDLLKRR